MPAAGPSAGLAENGWLGGGGSTTAAPPAAPAVGAAWGSQPAQESSWSSTPIGGGDDGGYSPPPAPPITSIETESVDPAEPYDVPKESGGVLQWVAVGALVCVLLGGGVFFMKNKPAPVASASPTPEVKVVPPSGEQFIKDAQRYMKNKEFRLAARAAKDACLFLEAKGDKKNLKVAQGLKRKAELAYASKLLDEAQRDHRKNDLIVARNKATEALELLQTNRGASGEIREAKNLIASSEPNRRQPAEQIQQQAQQAPDPGQPEVVVPSLGDGGSAVPQGRRGGGGGGGSAPPPPPSGGGDVAPPPPPPQNRPQNTYVPPPKTSSPARLGRQNLAPGL